MKRTKHITAFYLETLMLICVFVAVILILTRCLAAAEDSRSRSEELNNAVYLARNAAEAAAETEGTGSLQTLMPEVLRAEQEGNSLSLRYGDDLWPDPEGRYLLRMAWSEKPEDERLVYWEITVENAHTGEALYSLETAVHINGGKGGGGT